MPNQITNVIVSQTIAPAPLTLQRTGAMVSQGGTTNAVGSLTLLTQASDLTASLAPAKALTSIAWASSVVTATATAPHGWGIGDIINVTIAGVTPAGYNGTFSATVTSTTAFTYPLVANPGASTIQGTAILGAVGVLTSMVTTFFAQGSGVGVYVLELGEASVATNVAALATYITANPGTIYRWLVPRNWDGVAAFLALLTTFNGQTARTYFHVTSTVGTYAAYTALQKAAMVWIEAPTVGATEFSAAADFYVALNYSPSASNKVPPNAFAFLFGVTPYPIPGNNALFNSLKAAGINIVGTGAEGGISTAIAFWGTMMDKTDLSYWYSVDWVQINVQQAVTNEVINGSNNPQNPLYYDQNGINRLAGRAQATMNSGISFGLALAPAILTATSFVDYTTANPADYAAGTYNGLAVTYTPNRGFKSITFNVQVSNIPLS